MKISRLYRGALAALNFLLLLQVVPACVANVMDIINHQVQGAAWTRWLFLVNSFVVIFSSVVAFLTVVLCMNVRFGRFVLWLDICIKFMAMCAYSVLVGFMIHTVVVQTQTAPATVPIAEIVASVWASGVTETFLCLWTIIFELSFLIWRKRSEQHSYKELSLNDPSDMRHSDVWK